MKYNYTTSGTCSRSIEFEIDDERRLHNVQFAGGCNGNLRGIGALIEGLSAEDAMKRLRGIECGAKGTSCPDQLSRALEEALARL